MPMDIMSIYMHPALPVPKPCTTCHANQYWNFAFHKKIGKELPTCC